MVTEGLLLYLRTADVSALAGDLLARSSFQLWALDLVADKFVSWTRGKAVARRLADAGASFQFAPPEGADFIRELGWIVLEHRNPLREAFRLK